MQLRDNGGGGIIGIGGSNKRRGGPIARGYGLYRTYFGGDVLDLFDCHNRCRGDANCSTD